MLIIKLTNHKTMIDIRVSKSGPEGPTNFFLLPEKSYLKTVVMLTTDNE